MSTLSLDERQALLALPAGRDLDAALAEHALGWARVIDDTHDYNGVRHNTPVLIRPGETLYSLREWLPRKGSIPLYFFCNRWSTDLADAFAILPTFERRGWLWELHSTPEGLRRFRWHLPDSARTVNAQARGEGATIPEAICRATLAAALGVWGDW